MPHEVRLEERLAARDGDAALASPVAAITLRLVKEVRRLHERAAVEGPGIGVVTVTAAHGAALEEDDEAHARAVCRAKRFCRVNTSLHGLPPFKGESAVATCALPSCGLKCNGGCPSGP